MKKRLDIIFLSFGFGLFLYTIIGREIAMQIYHSAGNGEPLWLLLPSFLLISIGGNRNVSHKSEAELVPNLVRP